MKYLEIRNKEHEIAGYAKVSDEDFAEVSKYNWTWHNQGYVCARVNGCMTLLHRFVMEMKYGHSNFKMVDHINHYKEDCRRENLRIANASSNARNRQKAAGTICKFKGVTRRTLKNGEYRYVARIFVDNKAYYCGCYKTEAEAAMAYNQKAIELFGEYACINEHIA